MQTTKSGKKTLGNHRFVHKIFINYAYATGKNQFRILSDIAFSHMQHTVGDSPLYHYWKYYGLGKGALRIEHVRYKIDDFYTFILNSPDYNLHL